MTDALFLDERYELGVLLVHGIGQTKEGDTLARFGEPLRVAAERLAQPAAGAGADLVVTGAWLKEPSNTTDPCRAELVLQNVLPARRGTEAIRSRWLMAEAWWAAQFPAPTFSEVAFWATSALPGTLLGHVDKRLRRAGYAFAEHWAERSVSGVAASLPRWLLEWSMVLLGLGALPALIVVLLVLLVAGLLPAPLNGIAARLQRVLAATIGDSYALKHNRLKEGAILSRVQERFEWLAARCHKVVIVAHSQGGAIAHQMLRSTLTAPCDALITVGSGLAKLSDIEREQHDAARATPWLWVAVAGAVLTSAGLLVLLADSSFGLVAGVSAMGALDALFIFYVFAVVVQIELVNEISAPPATARSASAPLAIYLALGVGIPVGIGASLLFAGVDPWLAVARAAPALAMTGGLALLHAGYRGWQKARGRFQAQQRQWERDRDDYRSYYEIKARQNMRWLDLFTRHDPVPNGPLLEDWRPASVTTGAAPANQSPPLPLESHEVHNVGSAVLDHTTYFSAHDDFVVRVARLLLRTAGIKVRAVHIVRGAARRRWRVGILRWTRAANVVGAAIVGVGFVRQPSDGYLGGSTFSYEEPAGAASSGWERVQAWWATNVFAPSAWHDEFAGTLASGWQKVQPFLTHPLGAALTAWACVTVVTALLWGAWSRRELAQLYAREDYLPVPQPMALLLTTSAAFVLGSLAWIQGGTWSIGGAGILALAALLLLAPPVRAWLVLRAQSGTANELDALEAAALRRQLRHALKRKSWHAVASIARRLLWHNDSRGALALGRAIGKGHPWVTADLVWYYERRGRQAPTPVRRRRYEAAAFAALMRGSRFGDPWSDRSLGNRFNERFRARGDADDRQRALHHFKLAVDRGDASACHSAALLLDRDRDAAEIRRLFELGAARDDNLSAAWLAEDLQREARAAGAGGAALRERSAALFRKAFDCGNADAAVSAGDLYVEIGDLKTARRAYTLGARFRSGSAALGLARLEEQHAGDPDAAKRAFEWALHLKTSSPATAFFGLGRVLEASGRQKAAKMNYEQALRAGEDATDAAQAGVRLAAMLELEGQVDQAKQILTDAGRLKQHVAVEPYVALIVRTDDARAATAIPAEWVDAIPTELRLDLAAMLTWRDANEALRWTLRALEKRRLDAEPERLASVLMKLDSQGVALVLQRVAEQGASSSDRVAHALETRGAEVLARRLRALLPADGSPQDAAG